MTHRASPLALALSLAAAVVVGVAPAPAAKAGGPAVIRLVSTTTSYRATDTKPKGASAGDRQVFTSSLRNAAAQFGRPKGAMVGTDRSALVLTAAGRAQMTTVAKLPGGTLVVRGLLSDAGKGAVSIPVVSGTGRFDGARGTLTILKPTGPKTAGNVYRLSYGPVA